MHEKQRTAKHGGSVRVVKTLDDSIKQEPSAAQFKNITKHWTGEQCTLQNMHIIRTWYQFVLSFLDIFFF